MEKIIVNTIPHIDQIYDCVGDYHYDKEGSKVFDISDVQNRWYESLVFIHEFIELLLMEKRGITIKSVIEFDINFEQERVLGKHNDTEEPGDAPDAPYKTEHHFSEIIERMVCFELGIDWDEYCKAMDSLDYYTNKKREHGLHA